MFILECIAIGLSGGWVFYKLAAFDATHRHQFATRSHVRLVEEWDGDCARLVGVDDRW